MSRLSATLAALLVLAISSPFYQPIFTVTMLSMTQSLKMNSGGNRRQFTYIDNACSFCSSDQMRSRSEMSGSVILLSNLICGIELAV